MTNRKQSRNRLTVLIIAVLAVLGLLANVMEPVIKIVPPKQFSVVMSTPDGHRGLVNIGTPPPGHVLAFGTTSNQVGDSYFTSLDGGVNIARNVHNIPTVAQCNANRGQSTTRTVHFTSIEAAMNCAVHCGDAVIINGQNGDATTAKYNESGFGYDEKPLPHVGCSYTRTANTTVNTLAVTLSSPNASIAVGQHVWGTGIMSGTRVTSVSGTAVTIDQYALSTQSGTTLTFSSDTAIIGRCNADVITGNLTFNKATTCRAMIQPLPAEWGLTGSLTSMAAVGYDHRSIFLIAKGPQFLDIDNLSFDASNIGATGADGHWDGTLCQCLATNAISFQDGGISSAPSTASALMGGYTVVENSLFKSLPGQALGSQTEFYGTVEGDPNASKQSFFSSMYNTFVNNDQTYQAVQSLRFGSPGSGAPCNGPPTVCNTYWSHNHDVYWGASDAVFFGNTFSNSAGGSFQIYNSVHDSAHGGNMDNGQPGIYHIYVIRNLWDRGGWKSKTVDNNPNSSAGSFMGGNSFKGIIENNIFANSTNFDLATFGSKIDNNSFVLNSDGVNTSPSGVAVASFFITNGYNNAYFNNALCYQRTLTNTAENQIQTWKLSGSVVQVTANAQLGSDYGDGHRTFSVNQNNLYSCSSSLFTGYTPPTGAPDSSMVIDPGTLIPAASSAADAAGIASVTYTPTGGSATTAYAPVLDYFGNTRTGTMDIGAVDSAGVPPATTTTTIGVTTTAAPTTTTTTIPGTGEQAYDPATSPPSSIAIGSAYAVETAHRVTTNCAGTLTGVWWYRTTSDTGVITVNAWRSGTVVATGSGDPAAGPGWSYLTFASPVSVTISDHLLIGVHHPNGSYGYTSAGFASTGRTSPSGCLSIDPSTTGNKNGMYDYSATPVLPTLSYNDTDYWLSPQFVPTPPVTTTTIAGTTTTVTTTTVAPTTTTTTIPTVPGGCQRIEAENFSAATGVTIGDPTFAPAAGVSGSGYVWDYGPVGTNASWSVVVATSGTYTIKTRYETNFVDSGATVSIDGAVVLNYSLPGGASSAWAISPVSLSFTVLSGTRTLNFAGTGQYANLDYTDLCFVAALPTTTTAVATTTTTSTTTTIPRTTTTAAGTTTTTSTTSTTTIPAFTTTRVGVYYPVKCVRTPRRTIICTQNGRVVSTSQH